MEKEVAGRLLAAIVQLRLFARTTREAETRAKARELEWSLRSLLPAGIPKRQAAALLGVSVPALDKWIARGRVAVVAREGTARRTVETRALLELAEQVETVRREGSERGALSAALGRLGRLDDPGGEQVLREEIARLPRPNVSVPQLRADYERIPADERVARLTALHRSLNTLAQGRR